MLVLSRRIGEEIVIGAAVTVRVAKLSRNQVSLAIDAPTSVSVARREIVRWDRQERRALECRRLAETTKEPQESGQDRSAGDGRDEPALIPSGTETITTHERAASHGENGNAAEYRDAGVQGRRELAPPTDPTDATSFRSAINCLIADNQMRYGSEIEFCDDLDGDEFRPELQAALISIVRELLSNACRHSKSKNVLLGLTQDDGFLCIQVQDWGTGFEPANLPSHKLGLRRIRDLAGWLGGAARLDSQSGAGTCVIVEVPLRNETGSPIPVRQCGKVDGAV